MNAGPPLLAHVFPSFEVGGSQMRTARLIDGFGAQFRHALISLSGRTEARELLQDPGRLQVLPAPPKAGSLRTSLALRSRLASLRPALLLTYNFGALDGQAAARLLGLPAIHHEDGFGPDEARARKPRRNLLRRLLLPGARAVVVPSRLLHSIAEREWGLGAPRLVYIPNGIDLERFAPGGPRADLGRVGLVPGRPTIVALGSLRPEKNLERLIAAFEALPAALGAQLLIVGGGAETPRLAARAAASPRAAAIALAGPQADPAPWLRAAQVLALSSDTEQMPLSLVEAMAAGLPAAAMDVGDVRGMLPAGQAPYLVASPAPGSPREAGAEALAAALAGLLADPERARALGRANLELARQRYAFEGMLAAYRGLYLLHARPLREAPSRS
jgi:glycosyltransferase involved in cell wall biosynthesis